MPGYRVEFVSRSQDRDKFACIHCDLILKEPLQLLDDGTRICKSCFEETYEIEHSTSLGSITNGLGDDAIYGDLQPERQCVKEGNVFPDNFVWRQVKQLHVFCEHRDDGCPWQGLIGNLDEHIGLCEFRPVPCSQCQTHVAHAKIKEHLEKDCSGQERKCQFCNGNIKVPDIEHHEKECFRRSTSCEYCHESMSHEKKNDHLEFWCKDASRACSFSKIGCSQSKVLDKDTLKEHSKVGIISHVLLLLSFCINIKDSLSQLIQDFLAFQENVMSSMQHTIHEAVSRGVSSLNESMNVIFKWKDTTQKQLDYISRKLTEQEQNNSDTTSNLNDFVKESSSGRTRVDDIESKVVAQNIQICEQVTVIQDLTKEQAKLRDQIAALFDAMRDIKSGRKQEVPANTLPNLPAPVIPIPGSLDYVVSNDGILTWKISDVMQQRHEAITKKTTSIFSPPFFTGPRGYKMCARLYLNGDGLGKGSYLSLFFAVMNGPYDALLPWPFQQKIKMMLVDQDNIESYVDSFKPDPTSSSFQRPKGAINTASGSPLFFPLNELGSRGYLRDDTLFIKIIIDTQGLE